MTHDRQKLECWGESLAANYLNKRGYTIVDRNERNPYGEIDLVVLHDGVTVFAEVKTRTSHTYGLPEAAITKIKRDHILPAAQDYLLFYPEYDNDWRVDVISILHISGQDPEIEHFENAIN